MAGSVNKVILIGNLGAKPEVKYLPSGQAVSEMRIATNEVFNDKQNQRQERTEWHRVVVWGKTAENCAQYLDKGRSVYVEGRLQTRTWDDKTTGEKKYMTEIVANQVTFLGGGAGDRVEGSAGGGGGSGGYSRGGARNGGGNGHSAPPPSDDFGGAPSGGEDDIPF